MTSQLISTNGIITVKDSDESTLPVPSFKEVVLESGPVTSTFTDQVTNDLYVTLKMGVNLNGLSTLFESALSSLKIKIFQSYYLNSLEDIVEVHDGYIINSSTFIEDTINNKVSFDVVVDPQKVIPNPANLTYYAFVYLDVDSYLGDKGLNLGIKFGSSADNIINSPTTKQEVINSGEVSNTRFVYLVQSGNNSGKPWAGPVTKIENQYVGARYNSNDELEPTTPIVELDRVMVKDSIIQDFRSLASIEGLQIDIKPADFYDLKIFGRTNNTAFFNKSEAYTSQAYITRDLDRYCHFMFDLDVRSLLAEQGKFGKILENPNLPPGNRQKIENFSKIISLQIVRRQVDLAKRYNRLTTHIVGVSRSDLYPSEKLLVETSENSDGMLKIFTTYDEIFGAPLANNQVASIAEHPSIVSAAPGTKSIVVTDYSVRNFSSGAFQYGMNLSMKDGTIEFLNLRLDTLRKIRLMLDRYKNQLEIPDKTGNLRDKIYDYYTNLSSPESDDIKMIEEDDGIGINSNNPWDIAPEYLKDTLDTITNYQEILKSNQGNSKSNSQVSKEKSIFFNSQTDSPAVLVSGTNQTIEQTLNNPRTKKGSEYATAIKSLLIPNKATPESVISAIKIYEVLIETFEKDLGSSLNPAYGPKTQKSPGTAKNSRVSLIELLDYFPEVLDTQYSTYPTLEFIGFKTDNPKGVFPNSSANVNFNVQKLPSKMTDNANFDPKRANMAIGPQMISRANYLQRFQKENIIYWNDADINTVSDKIDKSLTENAKYMTDEEKSKYGDMKRTSMTYLTPAVIDGKSDKVIERLDMGSKTWDPAQYREMQNSVIAQTSGQYGGTGNPLDNILSQINLRVKKPGLPMAAEVEIANNRTSNLLPVEQILGDTDQQHNKFMNDLSEIDSTDCKMGEQEIGKCQAYSNASSVTQIFSNVLAQNGNFNNARSNTNAQSKLLGNPYQKSPSKSAQENYNLANTDNFFDSMRNSPVSQKGYDNIPPQTKALSLSIEDLAEKQGTEASKLAKNLGAVNTGLRVPGPIQVFNYGTMAKVLVFKGYEATSNGKKSLKRPKFETMSEPEWSSALNSLNNGQVLFCKLEKFTDTDIVGMSEGLDIPIANEYYFITETDAQTYSFSVSDGVITEPLAIETLGFIPTKGPRPLNLNNIESISETVVDFINDPANE